MSKKDINHTEEGIIGTEQGTTLPTKIGTPMCNALIDTGATRSCISKKYYWHLPSMRVHHLENMGIGLAMVGDLAPLGLMDCFLS